MSGETPEPANFGRRSSDRPGAALPSASIINRGTLLPLSLVGTLLFTTIAATRAWYATTAQLKGQAETLKQLTAKVNAIGAVQKDIQNEAWTESEMRDWIEAGRRGGIGLPSLEAAKWTLRGLPEWMRERDRPLTEGAR